MVVSFIDEWNWSRPQRCHNTLRNLVASKNQTNNFSGDGNWLHM